MESRNALHVDRDDLFDSQGTYTAGQCDRDTDNSLNDAKQQVKRKHKTEWENQIQYFLSCIAYTVGLGNLWRFPYLCFNHGGMSFLLPYFTCILLCGLPMTVMESCLGQFSGNGPICLWSMAPMFTGVGWGELLMSFYCCVYYNVIVAYALFYLYKSLPSVNFTEGNININTVLPYAPESPLCQSWNVTTDPDAQSCQEHYYNTEILQDSGDFTAGLFSPNWGLVFSLLVAWIIIFFTQSNSTKSTGKTSYITSTLPYICLTVLLIMTMRLDGSVSVGLKKYTTVNMTKLFETKVWADAALQVFWSQGVAWGVLTIYASHNPFRMDVYSYAWRQSLINGCTSIYAGVVVFGSLGYLAYEQNDHNVTLALENFDKTVAQSHRLAFVVYPTVLSTMGPGIGMLMAILFFAMLATLGIGSQVGVFMAVYEGIMEEVQFLSRHKMKFLIALCCLNVICALPLVSQSGILWLNWFDYYCSTLSLQTFALLEIIVVSWIYGVDRFIVDIEQMMGFELPMRNWWRLSWKWITPIYTALTLLLMIKSSWDSNFLLVKGIPVWGNVLGWMLPISELCFLPLLAWLNKCDITTHPRFYNRRQDYT